MVSSLISTGQVESELLHTYSRVDPFDVLILCVRVAVLTAVTLTVPIVLFPVSPLLRKWMKGWREVGCSSFTVYQKFVSSPVPKLQIIFVIHW